MQAEGKSAPCEFEVDGITLVYDYDLLTIAQMKLAEAVYQYQADLQKRPPRSLREKLELGAADYDQHVLSYILLKRQKDGTMQRFKGGETQKPILDLVNNIPSKDVKKAEDVILDFFQRRERYTLALLVRSQYEMQYVESMWSKSAGMLTQAISDESSTNEAEENPDSTTPTNDEGASANA